MATRNVDGDVHLDGVIYARSGASTDTIVVGGVMGVDTVFERPPPDVVVGGTPVYTYNVLANTLAVNGQSIWWEWLVTATSSVSAPAFFIFFGGQQIIRVGLNSMSDYILRGRSIRTGAATQKTYCTMTGVNAPGGYWNTVYVATTVNLAIDNLLSFNIDANSSSEWLDHQAAIVGFDGVNT